MNSFCSARVTGPGFPVPTGTLSTVRIGIDANYRFVSGVELPGFTSSQLSAPGIAIHAKFGVF